MIFTQKSKPLVMQLKEVLLNLKNFDKQLSLFTPLLDQGYTTIRILNRPGSREIITTCAREWDDLKWSQYMKEFDCDSTYGRTIDVLSHAETLALYERAGFAHYFESICEEVKKSGIERIEAWILREHDIRFFHVVDSSFPGLKNRRHPVRVGATRRYDPTIPEANVVLEAMNMARAMSLKSAAAGLPYGGSNNVIVARPIDQNNEDIIGFLAYSIDRTRSLSGPDMGIEPGIVDIINERYTPNIRGGTKSSVGPGGTLTAYGVMLALKVACEYIYGTPSTAGLSVAVMGMGSVGRAISEFLLAEGASLLVADILEEPVQKLLRDYPAGKGFNIKVVRPEEILSHAVDVFVPVSAGGVISEAVIQELKCKIIIGSANNVLAAAGEAEEMRLAKMMHEKGIFYQVEWVHNVGGILSAIEGYISDDKATADDVRCIIESVIPAATRRNVELAESRGTFPTAVAYDEAHRIFRKEHA